MAGPGEVLRRHDHSGIALSSATTSIRLGLMVAGVTYRHPSVFANQCLTIDHASHGRLDIGLGGAWFETGTGPLASTSRPPVNASLLEDQLEILTRLMSGDGVSYTGHHVSLTAARMRPVLVQQPHRRSGSVGPNQADDAARGAVRRLLAQLRRVLDRADQADGGTVRGDPGATRAKSCGWPLSLDGSPAEIETAQVIARERHQLPLLRVARRRARPHVERFATEVLPALRTDSRGLRSKLAKDGHPRTPTR